MFYLIGGAPRSGKTTIAKELSKKLNIPWISTDTLESTVMMYSDEETSSKLFPKKILRKLTNNSNDEFYTKYSAEEIVDSYIEQGKSLAKGIETFISCESSYNHSYILEGYHISPELVMALKDKFPLKAIFVGRENIEETLEAITGNVEKNDWVITKTKNAETYLLISKMLVAFSARVKINAEENKLTYVLISPDFKNSVQKIVEDLAS